VVGTMVSSLEYMLHILTVILRLYAPKYTMKTHFGATRRIIYIQWMLLNNEAPFKQELLFMVAPSSIHKYSYLAAARGSSSISLSQAGAGHCTLRRL